MNKIKFSLLALMLLVGLSSNAQAFEKGKSYASLSYGFQALSFGTLFKQYQSYGTYKYSQIGPIGLQYEYALSEDIGIGISAGYTGTTVSWNGYDDPTNNYKYTGSKITANARLNVHMGDHDKLDPYFGFGLGYKSNNWDLETNDSFFNGVSFKAIVPVSMEAKFGLRYFFIPQLAAFGELGIGHGFAHIGLTGKF